MHSRPAFAVLAAVIVALSAAAMAVHAGVTPSATSGSTPGHTAPVGAVAHPDAVRPVGPTMVRPGVTPVALTVIAPDGTINNGSAPITRNSAANSYTLTGDFIGGLLDERNGSTIIGAGYKLTMDKSLLYSLEFFQANNVAVSNLVVAGTGYGVFAEGCTGVTITNVTATVAEYGVAAWYGGDVVISGFNGQDTEGIYGYALAGLSVSHSNLTDSDDGVYFEDGSNFWVTNSTMYGSDDGVYSDYVSGNWAYHDNVSFTEYALYFYYDTGVWANWNVGFESTYFLYTEYTDGIWALNNSGQHCEYPLELYDGTNGWVDQFYGQFATEYGAYIGEMSNLTLEWVNVSGALGDYGMYIYDGTGVTLEHVVASGFYYYGVYVYDVSRLDLSWLNVSYGTDIDAYGLYTEENVGVSLSNDSVWGNYYGMYDDESVNISITTSHFEQNEYNLELEDETGVSVVNDDLYNASSEGLYVDEAVESTFAHDNITWSGDEAMEVEYSSGLTIENVAMENAADDGLYLYADSDVSVLNNQMGSLHSLDSEAFDAEDVTGAVIENNSAQGANYSAELDECASVLYENNNDSNSYYGIDLYYNSNTSIVGNEFWTVHQDFDLEGNGQTWIYHNNFVHDIGWLNYVDEVDDLQWSDGYPVGGNYWGNHTGPDAMSGPGQNVTGSDGIVDTPFVINATMVDAYPLAAPWVTHTATFTESGLAPGTSWSVTIGSHVWTSTGPAIVYDEPNGANSSYAYSVSHPNGYHVASPASGSVTGHDASASVHIVFTAFNYTVTFRAVGLTAGTSWSIVVNGATLTGSSTTITTSAINGTWAYVPQKVSGYALTSAPGNVTVNGVGPTVTVDYELLNNTSSSGGKGNNGATTSSNGNSYSNTDVYALIGLLVLALLLAIVGFALWGRARRPASGATPWTPPPSGPSPPTPPTGGAPPSGGSPPPGAMGGQ